MPRRLVVLFRAAAMGAGAAWAYRLRGAFIVLAVALGIASLSLIVASVEGASRKARQIVEVFGHDAALVLGGDITSRAVGRRRLTLSWDDARRMRRSLPGAYQVIPMRTKGGLTIRSGAQAMDLSRLIGATANYADAWDWPLSEGRDLSEEDVLRGAKVGLIGSAVSRQLFGDASPVGRTVFVDRLPIHIVGLLEERGALSGGHASVDDRVIIPLTTLTQRFNMDRQYFAALRIKFLDEEHMAAHKENLRSFLRHLHRIPDGEPDDFTIITADEILRFLSMLKGSLVAFLGVTAGVAILVGGFVLANLFHLSVSERAPEIGLRKAMGAPGWAVTAQFLSEAVLLTLVGGALGMGAGVGLGRAMSSLGVLQISLSPSVALLSLASAVAIGVVFGLKPARAAAAMDPIAALKR